MLWNAFKTPRKPSLETPLRTLYNNLSPQLNHQRKLRDSFVQNLIDPSQNDVPKIRQTNTLRQGSFIHQKVQSMIMTCGLESSGCADEPLAIGSSSPALEHSEPPIGGISSWHTGARHRWRLNTANHLASPSPADANPVLFHVCELTSMPLTKQTNMIKSFKQ